MSEKNAISEFMREVQEGQENIIKISEEVLKDGTKAKLFSLGQRKLQPEKPEPLPKAESPRRAHVFYAIAGFKKYLEAYKTKKDTVVYVNPQSEQIAAVLDEQAKNGFEILAMVPQLHPLFKPWSEILSQEQPLEDFVSFLLENRRAITEPNGKQLAMLLSQVRASTTIEMHKGKGKNSINGILCKTEIQSETRTDILELPDELKINVPIYVGTEPQEITIDLTLSTAGGNQIVMTATSSDVIDMKVKAFEEMIATLDGSGIMTVFGTPQHKDWAYLAGR